MIAADQDSVYNAACIVRDVAAANLRKAKRTRKRLEAVVSGGFVWFAPRQYSSVKEPTPVSTRGIRRRIQLGREKPADQSAVEVWGK